MQPVTVNYRQHNPTALRKWLRKRGQFWPNLLLLGIPVVTALPLLIGAARHEQWLALAMILVVMCYFLFLIIASQRRSVATATAKLPTMTFTLFPEGFQVDLECGSWSRRAWTGIEQFVPQENGLIFLIRESGREQFYEVPRTAFASPSEYEAWVTQAQRWHQEARAKQRVLAPAELPLTERYRIAQSLSYDELQVWLAQQKLAEEFPDTLPQTTPKEPPSSQGRDFVRGVLLLAACALLLYDPTSRHPADPGLMLGLMMLSFGLLLVYIKVTGSIVNKADRLKYVAEEPALVIFAEEGTLTRARHHEHFRSWLDVDALTVDQARLLLWFRGISCGIFPQRAFANAEEAAEVEEWIRAKIQQRDDDLDQAEFADPPHTLLDPGSNNPYQAPQH